MGLVISVVRGSLETAGGMEGGAARGWAVAEGMKAPRGGSVGEAVCAEGAGGRSARH